MRRLNMLWVGVLAALALAGMTAGAASAAKAGLNLDIGGVPVANGSPAFATVGFEEGQCESTGEGTVTANGKSKDKATFTALAEPDECYGAGESMTGQVTSAQVALSGAASFKANVVISKPGPCLYSIKKFSVTFPGIGFYTEAVGSTTAKAGKGSSKSCTKSINVVTEVFLSSEYFANPFVLELT